MCILVKDIIQAIEDFAPVSLQESWDNSGLIVGNSQMQIDSALITLDVTEAVVDEAIAHGNGLIIAHHPLIFGGIKQINGNSDAERAIIKAIKNNVAIYAAHTNIDSVAHGVSWKMAKKLALKNIQTLQKQKRLFKKLVTYVPTDDFKLVQKAVFEAGAGHIGNYDSCGFSVNGKGSFRGDDTTNPYKGEKGKMHSEIEIRFETVFPSYLQSRVIHALIHSHPYEEVAYDIYSLDNEYPGAGIGIVGQLEMPEDSLLFLKRLRDVFQCDIIKHTAIHRNEVLKVAMVGGSGSSYLKYAMAAGADVFISADFKYHQLFEAENKIIIADIGHYESEQFTKELFYEIVTNKFSKFALRLSQVKTNPINYLF